MFVLELWTEFFLFGFMAQCKQHQSERAINPMGKRGSVTYRKDLENEVLVRYLSFLWVQKERKVFRWPYSEKRPAKLTNHNARMNKVI